MSTQDVLVVAEIQRETLGEVTLELLAAARSLAAATGGQVVALALSADGARYAAALGAADRIVLVDDPLLAEPTRRSPSWPPCKRWSPRSSPARC